MQRLIEKKCVTVLSTVRVLFQGVSQHFFFHFLYLKSPYSQKLTQHLECIQYGFNT